MNWNGNEKKEMRDIALEHTGKAVKTAIMFPSYSKKCVIEGLKNGKFDSNTFMIAVEKEAKYIETIHNFMRKHFKNYYIHKGPLETLNLDKVLFTGSIFDEKKIDYAFFDFCGNLTHKIAYWLNKYTHCFKTNAKVVFTFYAKNRKKKFEKLIWKHTDKEVLPEVAEKLRYTVHNLLDVIYNGNLIKNIQFDCQTLYLAFEQKEINFDYIYRYKDSSDMVLIGCNVSKEPNGRNDFIEFLDENNEKWGYASQVIRRGRQKKSKTEKNIKKAYIDRLNITCLEDLNKPAIKAWITRFAREDNTTVKAIIAGIKRSLTIRNKKAA